VGAQGTFDPSSGGNHNLRRTGRSDDLAINIDRTFGIDITFDDQITGKDAAQVICAGGFWPNREFVIGGHVRAFYLLQLAGTGTEAKSEGNRLSSYRRRSPVSRAS
jgi:hypothetical protein